MPIQYTTRRHAVALPEIGERITVDGIPGVVTSVDAATGVDYDVTIPGLFDRDGKPVTVSKHLPWSQVGGSVVTA